MCKDLYESDLNNRSSPSLVLGGQILGQELSYRQKKQGDRRDHSG